MNDATIPSAGQRQVGLADLHPLDLVRIHRGAAHLHDLGQRPLGEALVELAQHGGPAAVLDVLACYGRLTPAMVRAAGADQPLVHQLVMVP
jgi:hypothetical protein